MKSRPRNLGRFRWFCVFTVRCVKWIHGKRFATDAVDAGTNRISYVLDSVVAIGNGLRCCRIDNTGFPRTKDATMIGWIMVAFAG